MSSGEWHKMWGHLFMSHRWVMLEIEGPTVSAVCKVEPVSRTVSANLTFSEHQTDLDIANTFTCSYPRFHSA